MTVSLGYLTCKRLLFPGLCLFAALLSSQYLSAQTSTGLSADHLGGTEGTLTLEVINSTSATVTESPSWVTLLSQQSVFDRNEGGDNIYLVTVRWRYDPNWGPDETTAQRTGTVTAEGTSVTLTQTGIDNTYVYDPPKGDWPTSLSYDPNSLPDEDYEIKVYSRVRYSRFAVLDTGTNWGDWITYQTSFGSDTRTVGGDYQGRTYYGTITLTVEDHHEPDAVTQDRTANIAIGAQGVFGDTFNLTQEGVDNTYVYDPPKGDWPTSLSYDPNSYPDEDYEIKVYSRVRYSRFAVLETGINWGNWITYETSFGSNTRTVGADYQGRTYYGTITLTVEDHHEPDAVTQDRHANIAIGAPGVFGDTFNLTQKGVDNTYVYDPPKGDWPTVLEYDPNSFPDEDYEIRVYSRVRYSRFDVVDTGTNWEDWITYEKSFGSDTRTIGSDYQGRTFYGTITLTVEDHHEPDAQTQDRTATIDVGAQGVHGDVFNLTQEGVDNTYVYDPPQGDWPNLIPADPSGALTVEVYSRVRFSPFGVSQTGHDWGDWMTYSPVSRADTWILGPEYQGRPYSGSFTLTVSDNFDSQNSTGSRVGHVSAGAPNAYGDVFTIEQEGVENVTSVTVAPREVGFLGGAVTATVIGSAQHTGFSYDSSATPWISGGGTAPLLDVNGEKTGTATFTVAAQGTSSQQNWFEPREGTVEVDGETYAIFQGGGGLQFESIRVLTEGEGLIQISYEVGQQASSNHIDLFYSLDGVNYIVIDDLDFENPAGRVGNNVAPGSYTVVWNADSLGEVLDKETPVLLKIEDAQGFVDHSDAFYPSDPCYSGIGVNGKTLNCDTCNGPAYSESEARNSIRYTYSLGSDAQGRSFGQLGVHEEVANHSLRTPESLWKATTTLAQTFPPNDPEFTQILTDAALYEISDADPNDSVWTIAAYHRATELGAYDSVNEVYDQNSQTAFHTTTFTAVDDAQGFIERFEVVEAGVYGDRQHLFEWSPDVNGNPCWLLEQVDPVFGTVRREKVTEVTSPDGLTTVTTRQVLEPDGTLASEEAITEYEFPFGERTTQRKVSVVETDGSVSSYRTTFYTYGETPGVAGYGLLAETYTDFDSTWMAYTYGADGIATIRRPYRSAGRGDVDSSLDVTTISWETGEFGLGAANDLAKTETRTQGGQVASRTFEIFFGDLQTGTLSDGSTSFDYEEEWVIRATNAGVTTPSAALSSPNVLIQKNRRFKGGAYDGEIRSSQQSDGTIVINEYASGQSSTWAGEPNATSDGVVDGIETRILFNAFGEPTLSQITDIATGLIFQQMTVLATETLGRATEIQHIDGTRSYASYTCCGLASETNREGVSTSYSRDMLGRLHSITRLGVSTIYDVDVLGRVKSVTESGGALSIVRSTVARDSLEQSVTVTDGVSRATTSTVSFDGGNGARTITTNHPDAGTTVQAFGTDGLVTSVSGSAAYPIKYNYGVDPALGRFIETILVGDGGIEANKRTTYYDLAGRATDTVSTHESGTDATLSRTYSSGGRLIGVADADGVTTLFEYNGRGEVTASGIDEDLSGVLERGGTDRITEIDRTFATRGGKVVRRTTTRVYETDGSATASEISVNDEAVDGLDSWITVAGLLTHTHVDLLGNGLTRTTITAPDLTQEVVDAIDGRPTIRKTLDSGGAMITQESYTYDDLHRLETATDLRNGTSTYTYHNDDQIASVTLPSAGGVAPAQVTGFAYDSAGRLSVTTHPDSLTETRAYFPTGDLMSHFGARVHTANYTYDSQGRTRTLTTAGGVTTWDYYPESGRLKQKLDANNKGPLYTYTAAGRVHDRTSGRQIVTTYGYNSAGDLTSQSYSDTTPSVTFTQDRRGRLATATRAGVTTTLAHTILGQLDSESFTGGPLDGVQLDTSFDGLRRRDGQTITGTGWAHATDYSYDTAGRLRQLDYEDHTASYSYHANSNLLDAITLRRNGVEVVSSNRSWDKLNRLTSVATNASGGHQQSYSYDYNVLNQREQVTREDSTYTQFLYDARGHLEKSSQHLADTTVMAGRTFEYDFDGIGNRTQATYGAAHQIDYVSATGDTNQYATVTHPGVVLVNGEVNAAATVEVDGQTATDRQGDYFNHEVALVNSPTAAASDIDVDATIGATTETRTREAFVPKASSSWTYDDDGNLTFDGRLDYTWDAENRLIAVQTRVGQETTGAALPALRQAMEYDYRGRRVRCQTWYQLNGTEVLGEDEVYVYDDWNIVAILDGQNGELRQQFVWGQDLTQTMDGAGGVAGLLIVNDVKLRQAHYPFYDGNGNVVGLIAANDPSENAPTGYPGQGEVSALYEYDAFGNELRATGVAAARNPIRFSTKLKDEATGFSYYGYRFYDPVAGRWLNRDPLGEDGGLNLYGFVGNDPVNAVDVLGMEPLVTSIGDGSLLVHRRGALPIHYVVGSDGGYIFVPEIGAFFEDDGSFIPSLRSGGVETSGDSSNANAYNTKDWDLAIIEGRFKPLDPGAPNPLLDQKDRVFRQASNALTVAEVGFNVLSPDPIGELAVLYASYRLAKGFGSTRSLDEVVASTRASDDVCEAPAQGTSFFDDLARNATRNADSEKVVVGKWNTTGQSYHKVAAHYNASYFKLENWRELSKTLTDEEVWKVNEAFLRQQIKQGKQIILSHDPATATGFFKNEVDFLSQLYRFERDGWVWKAILK